MSLIYTLKKIQQAREEIKSFIERATIIFIDMAESTYYKNEKGIELGVEKVVNFNLGTTEIIKEKGKEYVQNEEIEKYDISKYIGDEVMAYFKGKDSAKVAVEIAIQIQRHFEEVNRRKRDELEKYKPKIGIDFGDVLFAQYYVSSPLDPHGLAVDRASRIVRLAKPYQILISEEIKNLVEGKMTIQTSIMEKRKFKGIKEEVKIYEVIWDEKIGQLGIKIEEEPSVSMISADEPTVFRFIQDKNLLERSKQIDLSLYTYETLASALRFKLLQSKTQMKFRVLIRNPSRDPKKDANIKGSISNMAEVISKNPKISFDVRFYDDEPLLRTYIFHKENNETEGLLGLYKYDPNHEMKFVGAEYNYLIYARAIPLFEKHLLNIFQSRFNYKWNKLTIQKAVIFDLDGVLIDSMLFYYWAWNEAFKKVGISINKEDIYEREGEKGEITARELYKKYKGKEPNSDIINVITETKDEAFRRIFKVQIFPGALELLTSLKSKSVKLGLVTGSTSLADKFKKHNKFLEIFDAIVTGEDTKNGKPMPDPYLMAVQKLAVSTKNCYAVENSLLGIKSAIEAGLTCFVVKGPFSLSDKMLKNAGVNYIYKNIIELKKHLIWADTNIHMRDFLDVFGQFL